MGKFEITTRKNGEFHFNLKAGNGQIILSSEGYNTKQGCKNGIESVRKNCDDNNKYDRLEAKGGKFYFNLKAGNGEIIGTSQMYADAGGRENGIKSVRTNGVDAEMIDLTVEK